MHIFVTHFDLDGSGRFLPILASWLDHYRRSGSTLPVSILTDERTKLPNYASPEDSIALEIVMAAHRVSTDLVDAHRDLCRPGNVYDYKSALICAALPHLPADSIIMDSDALVMRDITQRFDLFSGEPVAMPPDSGRRRIPWSGSHGKTIEEHSSSVLFFGDNSDGMREALVENYRRAWLWLDEHDDARGQIDKIREQRAWSLVHWWCDAVLMSEDVNWSHNYKDASKACIIHYHGAKKLTRMDGRVTYISPSTHKSTTTR